MLKIRFLSICSVGRADVALDAQVGAELDLCVVVRDVHRADQIGHSRLKTSLSQPCTDEFIQIGVGVWKQSGRRNSLKAQ